MTPPFPSPAELAELPPDGGSQFNRLVFERSPYLLQHARNPVDWYPWGDAAFDKARREGKPVFLSIGYSTCHWCHVMEHESFEDDEVAALLNRHFVAIKVDREERPDIDHVYMTVTQALTGSGGWPMTVVLTPEKEPFFAGTYFPKHGRYGRRGMMELLPAIAEAWDRQRDQVAREAQRIVGHLQKLSNTRPGGTLDAAVLDRAFAQLQARFDAERGGFSSAPKFPTPHNLLFLLRYAHRTGNAEALTMVERTLTAMRTGGIWDHIGFGFHRYSTDANWFLPHFEKMLYDQALLALAYLEAFQATGNGLFARTAREILTYIRRDMTSPEGGFYCAEDADSEGEEGLFYLWTTDEVRELLGPEEGQWFMDTFGFESGGNFSEEASGRSTGRNIPYLADPECLADPAHNERFERARAKLFAKRKVRVHPLKDDKILTDWNGLTIAAFARAAQVLNDPEYLAAAKAAADFLLAELRTPQGGTPQGRLLKRSRQGEAGLPAHLDDYAFTVWGLMELYEADFDPCTLEAALALHETMLEHFADAAAGGFFLTADDGEPLPVRSKEIYDGAIPSGNSVAALNLVRLARMTGRTDYEKQADALMRTFSGSVADNASMSTFLLLAVDLAVGPSHEVVITGDRGSKDLETLLRALRETYLPRKVVMFRPGDGAEALAKLAPFTAAMQPLDGQATAYVCRASACEQPTTDVDRMLAALGVGSRNIDTGNC